MGIFDKDSKSPIFINLDTGEMGAYMSQKDSTDAGFVFITCKAFNDLFGQVALSETFDTTYLHSVYPSQKSKLSVKEIKFYYNPNNKNGLLNRYLQTNTVEELELLRKKVNILRRENQQLQEENRKLRSGAKEIHAEYSDIGRRRRDESNSYPLTPRPGQEGGHYLE